MSDVFNASYVHKEEERSCDHVSLKDCVERDCELGMFAKWSSVKLIILSDNESRAPQG